LGDLKGYGFNYEGLYRSGYEVNGTVLRATSGFGIHSLIKLWVLSLEVMLINWATIRTRVMFQYEN
jgi:hypothetical protein